MATTRKRLLSLVMAVIMALSLLPISALAANESDAAKQTAQQIVNGGGTSYYMADGSAGSAAGYDVSVTKELTATGVENEFDVKVNVTYKNATTTTQSADAATALIIDTSGSMSYCAECGSEMEDEPTTHYYCPDGSGNEYYDARGDWTSNCYYCGQAKRDHIQKTVDGCPNGHGTRSRIEAAKEAACAFLDSYAAGAAEGTHRYVSLVTFAKTAYSKDLDTETGGKQYWVDVTDATALQRAKDVINGLSADGGTNTSGGVMLANNLFTQSSVNSPITGIENKFAVLLTDGLPTYRQTGSSTNVDSIGQNGGNGQDTGKNNSQAVQDTCNTLVNSTHVDLFAISYGLDGNITSGSGTSKPINTWLQDDCYVGKRPADDPTNPGQSDVFMAGNSAALNSAFTSILDSMEHTGSTGEAAGDVVSGGTEARDKCIGFVQFLNANGATEADGEIAWDLNQATEDTTGVPEGYTSYTMTYKVRLDNTGESFVEGAEYSAGAASFTYTDASTAAKYTKTSPAPVVKGYLGSLSFDKVSHHTVNGEQLKLSGAEFTLTSTSTDPSITRKASSSPVEGSEGKVLFDETIPSGYTYTMKETAAPEGYEPNGSEWTVTVAYGVVTVTLVKGDALSEGGSVVNKLAQTYKDLTLTKSWYMPANPQGGEATKPITVYVYQDGDTTTPFATLYLNGSTATVSNCADSNVKVEATENTTGSYWEYTLTVPDNNPENGGSHTYTISEPETAGFETSLSGLSLTNTSTGKTKVYVEKQWIVPEGVELTLPSTVQVEVLRNGASFGDGGHTYLTVDSDEATGNTVASLELDAYDGSGEYYTYTVSEVTGTTYQLVSVTGSGSQAEPFVITNTVANETTPVTVSKTWQDTGDGSKRPESIEVQLLQDGAAYGAPVTLEGESWSHDFGNLPKYKFLDADGNVTTDLSKVASVEAHTYTVQELEDFDGYTSSAEGLTLTNTRAETGTITVTKYWEDGITDGHTGSVVVRLNDGMGTEYADLTLNQANSWAASWENVPQFDATGNKITYTVSEVSGLENYVPVVSYGDNGETSAVFVDGAASVSITNTPNGSEDTTSVTVNKTWNHPSGYTAPGATFTLYQAKADGTPAAYEYPEGSTSTNPAENVTSTYTFTNLPKYYFEQDEDGNSVKVPYVYTVEESSVTNANGDSYTSTSSTETGEDGSLTYNFVNTITGSVSVQVSKEWIDLLAGDSNSRTAWATIQLQRSTDGTTWTDMDGKSVSTNVDNTVAWSGLDKYDATGNLYLYRVTEMAIVGYETPVISEDLDESANFEFTVTNKLAQSTTGAFTVTKSWVDGSAANADRPSITLTLKQGDSDYGTATVANDGTVTLAAGGNLTDGQVTAIVNTTADSWTVYFTGLPLYDIGASTVTAYSYSIEEAAVDGYQSVTVNSDGSNSATVTNTLAQGTKSATVTKIWVDPTTEHPDVTFTLSAKLASGTAVTTVGGVALPTTITLTQDAEAANADDSDNIYLAVGAGTNNWSYTVSGLPKYDDNRSEIFYTFDEPTAPDGYTVKALEVNGTAVPNTFVNTIEQATVSVAGTKAWNRDVEGDYYVPGTVGGIYVALYRDDNQLVPESELADGVTNPLYVTKGENGTDALWSFSFGELKKYDVDGDGHEYAYSVSEVYYEDVDGAQVLRKVEDNGSIVYGNDTYDVTYGTGNAITNTYDQPQKYWYRVDTSYTTVQSGTTIFSYSSTGTVQEFVGPGTLSVNPADYATLNGTSFDYVSANTRAFIDVADGADTELEFTSNTASNVSVTVDQINRVYVIHLEYVRTLYKLTTNYQYLTPQTIDGVETTKVYDSTTDPVQQTETTTDPSAYVDPGKYTATQAFTTERKTAPAGYEIVKVTLRNGTGAIQEVEVKGGNATFPDSGNFDSADVTVTYYYDKITAEHQTIGDEVTFTKKGDNGEIAGSGINNQITANAVFGLYSDISCSDESFLKELTVAADGKLTITAGKGLATDLGAGTYYLKETAAPTGYEIGAETVYTIVVASNDTSHWANNVWYPETTWSITVDGNTDVVNNMLKATYSVEYYFETGVNSNTYTQKSEYPDKTNLTITYFDTVSSSTYELGKADMGTVPDGYSLNGTKTGPATLTYAMVTADPAQNVIQLYYDLDMTQIPSLSVTKSWIGAEKTATVGLFETVEGVETLSGRSDAVKDITGNATASWSNLDEYTDGGKAITYAAYEVVDNGDGTYTKVASGDTVTIDGVKYLVSYANGTITNRELRDVTVTKAWSGTTDAEKAEVSLKLYAGKDQVKANALSAAVGGADGVITLNAANGYRVTYSDLYATDAQGNALTYSVRELDASGNAVAAGSRITLNGVNFTVSYSGTTVTNTKELGSIFVTKSFEGVSALGSDFLITVKNGTDTNAETVALLTVDGRTVNGQQTLAPANGDDKTTAYSWQITNLPTANTYYAAESGEDIANYTLQTGTVRSGSTTVDANKAIALKNIYLRDTVTMTITKDVTGDLSEKDFAKDSFTFKVYAGSSLVQTVTLPKADNSTASADWTAEFTVDTNTTYTVVEEGGSRDGFVLTVNGQADTTENRTVTQTVGTASVDVSYTNSYAQQFTDHNQGSFQIVKKDASNNNAAMAGVEFNLYTDETCTTPVQLTSNKTDDEGKLTVNIPESYLTGTEQTFYLKETVPAGYADNGTVWTVTATKPADNAGEPAVKITLNDNKTFFDRVYTWLMGIEDSNWADGVLTVYNTMEDYTITVKKVDGAGAALKGAAFTLGTDALTADSTGATFTSGTLHYSTADMTIAESTTPAGYDGVANILVAYDVQNGKVAGLKAAEGATLPTGVTINGFTVTVANAKRTAENLPVPASFAIHKVDSADPEVASNLENVGFTLYEADGETVYKAEVKTNANGLATFSGLAADGTYILKETSPLEGYTASSSTWTVTVSHTTSAESVNGDNKWQSKDNYAVSVKLNGEEQLLNGTMTVVNTRDTGSITVGKTSNHAGTYSIGVYTYDAAAKTYTLVDTAASLTVSTDVQKPTAEFANLPTGTYYVKEADAGKAYHSLQTTYTVNGTAAAANADGYVAVQLAKDAQVEVICDNQYTYVPSYTTLSIEKAWDDGGNRDGNRPDSITVSIADKNGANVTSALVITKNDEGKYTTDYRFDANGYTAPYTVTELGCTKGETYTAASAEGFEYTIAYLSGEGDAAKTDGTVVNGKITITNSYSPETLVIPVVKSWSGSYAGQNIKNVTLELYADDKPTGLVVELSSGNAVEGVSGKWFGLFESNYDAESGTGYTIYRNNDGKAITYSVKEIKLGDHTMTGSSWGYWTVTTGTSTAAKALPESWNPDLNLAEDALVLTVNNRYHVPSDGNTPDPDPDPDPTPNPDPTDIPDDPTPGGDKPGTSGDPTTNPAEDPTVIDDDPTPTGAPKTGDVSGIWVALASISACGIAALSIFGKRKKEEDQ